MPALDWPNLIVGAVLGSPVTALVVWLRYRWKTRGAEGITFMTKPPNRSDDPKIGFKCKVHVDIKNVGRRPIRLIDARFVFDKNCPIGPDPNWSCEHGTNRYPLSFFTPDAGQHKWGDVYLRPGDGTNVWLGINKDHPDVQINKAKDDKTLGMMTMYLTEWEDGLKPKWRQVEVKL
jgi:hypothetical protein